MAERRRIIPASVGPLFKDQRDNRTPPAVRLQLDLTRSATTEETCPEFAYPVLVKNVVGGDAESGQKGFNDIHEEDMAGLEEIAKKFEEKYNKPGKKGKKKKMVLEDLIDAGMGYDETDPFVDNSECYDELVPASLTTQFGGFYINSGQLKFKEISDSDDGDFQNKKPKTPKKKKKLKLENGEQRREKKMKRKLSSESGGTGDHISKKTKKQLKKKFREDKKKKGPRMIRTPTVAELLKRNTGESSPNSPQVQATSSVNGTPVPSPVPASSTKTPSTLPAAPSGQAAVSSSGGQGAGGMDMSLDLGINIPDMDKDLIDLVASFNGTEGMEGGVASMSGGGGDVDSDMNVSPSAPGAGEDGGAKEMVNLPDGLPLQLVDNIQKIKEAARKSVEGKTKFFNSAVNALLLKIEYGTRTLSCSKRSAVYTHLAGHLPCAKLTLQKRAKKLQLGAQDNQLREPLQRLREAITEVMPSQESRYKAECEEASLKFDLDPPRDKEGKVIQHKHPKKKFQWDDRLRRVLCDVVRVKVKTFEISKSRTQSAEEYLKAFLESEVKPLWAKDWIQTRNLYKESRDAHENVTMVAKQRKALAGGPRKLVLTPKQGGGADGEGTSTNHTPSEAQEGEPSSTQVNDMVGSPVTARHIEGVPTLLDYTGSGEDSMEAAITSSQYKGLEYATASSDSNQDASPSVAAGHSTAHDIPVSSSSPLPNLDPNFLVDQLICSQLVSDSQDVRPGQAQGSSAPVSSLSNPAARVTDDLSRVAGQRDMVTKSVGVKRSAGPVVQSTGETFPKQIGSDFVPNPQQSYAEKLAAISSIHTMRTLHNQEPGLQAKDVTSSSGGMMGVRPMGTGAPQRPVPSSQVVIRVKKDNKIEKMTAQSSSRPKVHAPQQKGVTSSKPLGMGGGAHQMPYSQSPSNTSIQGRSNVTSQRMGAAMDTLPQMSTQAAPGNGNVRVSPSSQSTSLPMTYVSPTSNQQRACSMHSAGSAFSTPTQQAQRSPQQLKAQTTSPRPQQTSPSAGGSHNYSPNSKQQYPSHQQYSPGHTSPIAASYSTSPSSYQSMGGGGYQQMPLGDMTARQGGATGSYPNNFPMGASQTPAQAGMAQSPVDAVITGPAPGTFFHSSSTDPRFVADGSSSQHRIH